MYDYVVHMSSGSTISLFTCQNGNIGQAIVLICNPALPFLPAKLSNMSAIGWWLVDSQVSLYMLRSTRD